MLDQNDDRQRDDKINYIDGLIFPLGQRNWPIKIWFAPLVNLVPILGLIAIRGWRVDIVRRMGRGEEQLLPNPSDIGRFLGRGTTLWVMTGIYAIPEIILLAIFGSKIIKNILDILLWIWQTVFTDEPTVAFSVLLAKVGMSLIAQLIIPGAYYFLSWPLYRAAMIRYSVTGNAALFFDIFRNIGLVIKYLDNFMLVFFYTILTQIMIALISGMFLATVVGSILIPLFSVPLFYWTTGYLYGKLAAIVLSGGKISDR